jgi:hypothetical protein
MIFWKNFATDGVILTGIYGNDSTVTFENIEGSGEYLRWSPKPKSSVSNSNVSIVHKEIETIETADVLWKELCYRRRDSHWNIWKRQHRYVWKYRGIWRAPMLGLARSLDIFKRNGAVVSIYSSENHAVGSKVLSTYTAKQAKTHGDTYKQEAVGIVLLFQTPDYR